MKKIPLKIKLLLLAAIPITAFIVSGTVSVKKFILPGLMTLHCKSSI